MNIFDLVNSDSEENIAKRLGLPLANDQKSYICPECGNGSGDTGDGIKQSTWNGRLVWHCYRCGGHWSNVDLIALVKGIETTDTKELVKVNMAQRIFLFSRKILLQNRQRRRCRRLRQRIMERLFIRIIKKRRRNFWKNEAGAIAV